MLATCVQIGKLIFVMFFLSHFVLLSHVCHVFVTYLSLYMFYVRVMSALVNSPHLYVFSTHLYIVQLLQYYRPIFTLSFIKCSSITG